MRPKKIGFWSQVGITFFIVSGGPYGIESAVGAIGPGWTVALLILLPFFWALPITMMVAELSSIMPEAGGYYAWVKKAMGPFWSFQEGWWTLCYSAVDLAIYPVLFVTYLSYFWPGLQESAWRWPLASLFALCGFFANLRGSQRIGKEKITEIILVMLPFFLLVGMGYFYGDWSLPKQAFTDLIYPKSMGPSGASLAAGLAILIWNFSGWDNACTYADEIENASSSLPKSQFLTLGLVVISYLLPLLIGLKATIKPSDWGEGSGWPEIAAKLVGPWLGVVIGFAALISVWALFNSQLLYIARLPAAMADDGTLPKVFSKKSKIKNVPWVSLAAAALAAAIFCGFSFGKLMILDIIFYSMGMSLEFISLIILRIKQPTLIRPFRIPMPTWGLFILAAMPLSLSLIVGVSSIYGDGGSFLQVALACAAIIIGFLVYKIRRLSLLKDNL